MGNQYDLGTIAHFKARLLTRRVEIMARLQRNGDPIFVEELRGVERMDRCQAIEHHHLAVAGDRNSLQDIEKALQKCEDGTYGICPVCGEQILLARLEAIPTASMCVPCYAKHKNEASTTRVNHGKKVKVT